MPRPANLTAADIAAIETALHVKLPAEYVQFIASYPFPDMTYMGADDLLELHELRPSLIITVNDSLRESTASPYAWKEHWFSIGERAGDEAVFYLDLNYQGSGCPVYVLDIDDQEGAPVADSFAVWADHIVQALERYDQSCVTWHNRQQGRWWSFQRLWNRKKP